MNKTLAEKTTLDNGCTLISIKVQRLTKVWFTLRMKGGSDIEQNPWVDSKIRRGSFHLMTQLLATSSEMLSQQKMSAIKKKHAIEQTNICGEGFFGFNLSFLREKTLEAKHLVRAILARDFFNPEEFEREKREIIYILKKSEEMGEQMAMQSFLRNFFAASPYESDVRGSIDTLEKIKIEEIESLWSRYFDPEGAVAMITGHSEGVESEMASLLSEVFAKKQTTKLKHGSKKKQEGKVGKVERRGERGESGILLFREDFIDRLRTLKKENRLVKKSYPKGKQVFVKLGFSLPSIREKNYLCGRLVVSYLTGMSSPLFALRNAPFVKNGVNLGGRAYVMGARQLSSYGYGGLVFYASLREEAKEEWAWTLENFYAIANTLVERGMTDEEIKENIDAIRAEQFLQMGKIEYKASRYVMYESFGLGYRMWEKEIGLLEKITKEDIKGFCKKYLVKDNSLQHVFFPGNSD